MPETPENPESAGPKPEPAPQQTQAPPSTEAAGASAGSAGAPTATAEPAEGASGPGSSSLELPPAPSDQGLARLREWTTTIFATVILAVSMMMLTMTFWAAKPDVALMKDIMLYALPLLGSVIGYYFGRVPAERRADAAESSRQAADQGAAAANSAAGAAEQKARSEAEARQSTETTNTQLRESVEKAKGVLQQATAGAMPPAPRSGGVLGAPAAPAAPAAAPAPDSTEAIRRALQELEIASRLR